MRRKDALTLLISVIIIAALGMGISYVFRESGPQTATGAGGENVTLYYQTQAEGDGICNGVALGGVETHASVDADAKVYEKAARTVDGFTQRELTAREQDAGLSSPFPHPGFQLISSSIDGTTLHLRFTSAPDLVANECEGKLIREQIASVAQQFEGIDEIRIAPTTLLEATAK